jgi:glycosyltransferase involved in cell wall biosynthesis
MHDQTENREKIRVLHVLDKFSIDGQTLHGVARLMSWWVNAIDRERFELKILGLRAPDKAGRYVEAQGGDVFYSDRGKLNPVSLFDILQVARETSTDVLHLHGYKSCTLGRIAGAILGIPVILHEHGAFPSVPFHQRVADWLLAPLDDKMIAVSEAVAEFCVELRSVAPEKIEVIPNSIPLDDFRNVPEHAAEEAAGEFGFNSNAPIIGTVGRLDEEKGVTYLLDAIPLIQAEIPEVKVLIVGDGTLRADLERKAEKLGIIEDVIFTGERRDVPQLYKLMDVKVIPSIHEGGPLTLFEAMAAGTPVVATPVGMVEELIEDGDSGMLVQSQRPEEIAEAVLDLLGDRGRRTDIANEAKKRVLEYDIKTSIRRIEDIYREVLKREA